MITPKPLNILITKSLNSDERHSCILLKLDIDLIYISIRRAEPHIKARFGVRPLQIFHRVRTYIIEDYTSGYLMKPRSSASGHFRRMKLWLVFIYIACLGKIAVSSPVVKDEIQHNHENQNLVTENKIQDNNTKHSKKPVNTFDIESIDVRERNSRALPRYGNFEIPERANEGDLFQSVQKLPSETNAIYVIPHLRPGRSPLEISNLLEDYKLDVNDVFDEEDKRKRETMIPMLRFGKSDSLVWNPRFGKSLESIDEAVSSNKILDFQDGRVNTYSEDIQLNKKKNDAMIPMPRFGRSDSLIPVPRFGRSNSLIPALRFGRSDSLIPNPRFGRSDSLIPGPRFGRSDSLIPIPRFGKRSDSLIPIPRFGRSDSLIPIPRFGRSNSLIPITRFGRSVGNINESEDPALHSDNFDNRINEKQQNFQGNTFEGIKDFSREEYVDDIVKQNRDYETYNSVTKKNVDDNGTIIPYPRLGRVIETKSETVKEELESADMEIKRQTNESLIPQIRYGRSSGNVKTSENEQPNIFILPNIRPGRSSKNMVESKDEKMKSVQYGLLPYPRPGRTNTDNLENQYDKHINEFLSDTLDVLKRFDVDVGDQSDMNIEKIKASFETLILDPNYPKHSEPIKDLEKQLIKSEQDGSLFVIPYPRPGKRNARSSKSSADASNALNFPHLFKIKFDAKKKSDYVLPYPRLGKRYEEEVLTPNTEIESKENNNGKQNEKYKNNFFDLSTSVQKRTISPYPMLDSSNSILSHSKLGQSNSVLPYPRPGRSNSILPYPRLGRSDSILPYPRLGRSNVMLPYPRPGRSLNIVPYPRLGKSSSTVNYPRLGRSNSVIPFPRPGRSDLLLPYPRLGRSDLILPYPRPGRSDLILPYPRPGRSELIFSNTSPGKSINVLPHARFERSNTIVPIPRPGRSEKDENYMLLYPRMERDYQAQRSLLYGQRKDILKRDFQEHLIPSMQNEHSSINENEFLDSGIHLEDDKTEIKSSNIQNNPNLSKKLNKSIPIDESIYLLPYPRPGRFI
ncbi:hypothetical protein NPIL_198051 [Nephila pilipes]|uniref:Uncharacterized protein n=1 Tax=Nephila pilipes TaxID=299642 RepID=A0A8X6N6H2_NEPPI|nr:hypothetical protein NPIL_198051 [Nephila pilipes]